MKFKYLIIALNIIIVFILVILFFLRELFRVVVLASDLRFAAYPLIVFMLLILICLEIFFFYNYRLFSLLEREDWPALAYYLEEMLFTKGRYSARNVRLLASSYILISDYESVFKLEYKASIAKPASVYKNALIFGSARILKGNYRDAGEFYKTQLEKGKIKQNDRDWMRWFYAFSHLLGETYSQAESELLSLAQFSRNAFIMGLSAYFLHFFLAQRSFNRTECLAAAEKGVTGVKKVYKTATKWKKAAEEISKDFHIALIKKYIDETGEWLFSESETK